MADVEVEVQENPEVVTEPAEPVEGKVIYEQDLRAGAHRNGVADHLHGIAEVIAEPGGPGLPDEPSYHDHRPEPSGAPHPTWVRIVIAGAYLGFGSLMVYAGILVIKDLIRDRKNGPKEEAE